MDWYKHDAKAFNSSTADMSLVDRGAYITLLNQQWDREGYLPADERRIFRMVGAFTEEEQDAVRRVLAEKFELTDHGYANGRMLATIREAQEKSAKARKAAYARHANASADAERTQDERIQNAGGTRARARRASSSPSLSTSGSRGEGESEGEGGGDPLTEAVAAFNEIFCRQVYPQGRSTEYLRERLEEGATVAECVEVMESVAESDMAVGTPQDVFNAKVFNQVRRYLDSQPRPREGRPPDEEPPEWADARRWRWEDGDRVHDCGYRSVSGDMLPHQCEDVSEVQEPEAVSR